MGTAAVVVKRIGTAFHEFQLKILSNVGAIEAWLKVESNTFLRLNICFSWSNLKE